VALVEKGLTSVKAATKQKALDAILLYIEMDKPDPVLEELLPLLTHKLPKVIAATLSAFTAIYHSYGCKTVEPKPVLKYLPKIFGHGDKSVRAEGQNLTVELYRWLREGMKPLFWNELKPVQQQDIEKLFEKVKDEQPAKPERLLKSQQAAIETAGPQVAVEDDVPVGGEEDDGEVTLEPEYMTVDVFEKIPSDLQDRLSSSKWKDRKDVLDELYSAINVPAIQEGSFDEIIRGLAKCMKDANIAVVIVAANCVEAFAKGLRRSFAKYRSIVINPIMERLKERKQSVTDALAAALDAVFAATSLSDCLEDVLESMKHKNPLVKLEATRFLGRCLRTTKDAPSMPETKLIADSAKPLLADSQETQRSASVDVLGTLWKIMGDRVMNANFDGLDDARKAKIKESMDTAEVKAKYKPKAVAPPPKPAAVPAQKKPVVKKSSGTAPPKRVAPPPSPPAESAPPPLQSKLTARPGVPKEAAPRSLRPPTAGTLGKKVATPATAQSQAAASSSLASPGPRRPVHSPSSVEDDHIPAPKISRGLAGRQLSKPASGPATQPSPASATSSHALSSIERLELDELRAEVERLRSTNEHLRSEALKLSSQVNEYQNSNAGLIEENTRNVLSIKAKETQLVRARSDAESADQTVTQLQRQVDRLKRELGRMGRATSPTAAGSNSTEYFPDANDMDGDGLAGIGPRGKTGGMMSPPPATAASSREGRQDGDEYEDNVSRPLSPLHLIGAPRTNADSSVRPSRPLSMFVGLGAGARQPSYESQSQPNGDHHANNGNGTGNGKLTDSDARSSGTSSSSIPNGGGSREVSGGATANAQGTESWRRAAEVTQNLKARIELMKVRRENPMHG